MFGLAVGGTRVPRWLQATMEDQGACQALKSLSRSTASREGKGGKLITEIEFTESAREMVRGP